MFARFGPKKGNLDTNSANMTIKKYLCDAQVTAPIISYSKMSNISPTLLNCLEILLKIGILTPLIRPSIQKWRNEYGVVVCSLFIFKYNLCNVMLYHLEVISQNKHSFPRVEPFWHFLGLITLCIRNHFLKVIHTYSACHLE